MAVWFRQSVNGELQHSQVIAPHYEQQPDAELLELKAKGAEEKDWSVVWKDKNAFTAKKVRWGGDQCVREFWIE